MKLLKKGLSILLAVIMIININNIYVFANPDTTITGDFIVTGGTLGNDYTYGNNTLTIKSSTPVTISGTTTKDKIVVQSGVTANITLDNLSIIINDGGGSVPGSIAIDNVGATTKINLVGKNILHSGNSQSALHVPDGSSVTIEGIGSLDASVYDGAPAIGAGYYSSAGNITINDGNVVARGGYASAAIGSGSGGTGGNITINGGNITAFGGQKSSAIGGGLRGAGGNIIITGGIVNAFGGNDAPGIGGGFEGKAGNFSTGENGTAFINTNNISDKSKKDAWKGVIFDGNNGNVYGNQNIIKNAEFPLNKTMTIKENITLTVNDGSTLTNSGSLIVEGTINAPGSIINKGTITNYGSLKSDNTINNNGKIIQLGEIIGQVSGNEPVYPLQIDSKIDITRGSVTIISNGDKILIDQSGNLYKGTLNDTLTFSGASNSNAISIIDVGSNDKKIKVILEDLSIIVNRGIPFNILGSSVLMTIKGINYLKKDNNQDPGAGIHVPLGSNLVIEGDGSLETLGGAYSAGIGGQGSFRSCDISGSITINSGTIKSYGGWMGAAGIGGSTSYQTSCGSGNIIINDGNVIAVGGDGNFGRGGAGIGGGHGGSAGDITINGGVIFAKSFGGNGAGIGGGKDGSAGTFSTGINGHAFIDASSIQHQNNKSSWSGVIFEGVSGKLYNNMTLKNNVEISSDKTLVISDLLNLTIDSNAILTNRGTITNNGTITNGGTILNYGTITPNAPIGGTIKNPSQVSISFENFNGGQLNTPNTVNYGDTINIIVSVSPKTIIKSLQKTAIDSIDLYIGSIDEVNKLGNISVMDGKAKLQNVLIDGDKWMPNSNKNIIAVYGGSTNNSLLESSINTELTVNKGQRSISAPTVNSLTSTSISISAVIPSKVDGTVEYGYSTTDNSADVTNWQSGLTFTSLTQDTTYYFFSRVTGGTYFDDVISPSALIKTPLKEQFNLELGEKYYFDLSAMDVQGTINYELPDTDLYYVPFTYVGTINAYKLDASSNGDVSSSERANSYIHSLFLSDYVISRNVSWKNLNDDNLIFGKNYLNNGINYTLRSPSVGCASGSAEQIGGKPTNNEWENIYNKDHSFIKNINHSISSWGQDTAYNNSDMRINRGYLSSFDLTYSDIKTSDVTIGWRPILELPSNLNSNDLSKVVLNLNGGEIGTISDSINIITKSNTNYSLPSHLSIQAPTNKILIGWNTAQDGSGTSFEYNGEIDASVKQLYAMWDYPYELKPTAKIDYVNETLTGLIAKETYLIQCDQNEPRIVNANELGYISILEEYFGKSIKVIKKGVTGESNNSDPQIIAIDLRPEEPANNLRVYKDGTNINVLEGFSYTGCEFSKDGINWDVIYDFNKLAPNTTYSILVRYQAVYEKSFASKAKGMNVTTTNLDGSTILKPYEQVINKDTSTAISNFGDNSIFIDNNKSSGLKDITINFPTTSKDIEVFTDYSVNIPAGSSININDEAEVTTIINTSAYLDKEGNINFSNGGNIIVGGIGNISTNVKLPLKSKIYLRNDGTLFIPKDSIIATSNGNEITVPDFGATISPLGEVVVIVSNIKLNNSVVQKNKELLLIGTINPLEATNTNIVWSILNDNGTGASITNDNIFKAVTAGDVQVLATIKKGISAVTDYTQEITITVTNGNGNYSIITNGTTNFIINQAKQSVALKIGEGIKGFNATKFFYKATIDGVLLDLGTINGTEGVDGSIKDGSIVITIFKERLNKLGVGSHDLVITLKDGTTVSSSLTVTESLTPQTGDNSNSMLWIMMLLISSGLLSVVMRMKKKKIS
ncbi:MAG: LPXTG cell wall anchor domain-containing protein [Erysipelotrichaceae bacterium]